MTLLMKSGQNKSQSEKFQNLKNCQILRSWFYTKIPKKYFFGHVFPKKMDGQFLGHFLVFFPLST